MGFLKFFLLFIYDRFLGVMSPTCIVFSSYSNIYWCYQYFKRKLCWKVCFRKNARCVSGVLTVSFGKSLFFKYFYFGKIQLKTMGPSLLTPSKTSVIVEFKSCVNSLLGLGDTHSTEATF